MPYVITRTFSRHHDKDTETEFTPLLENGLWVGSAHVDEDKAKQFEGRHGFVVISDDEYKDILVPPTPTTPSTGDPLRDGAATIAPTATPPVTPAAPPAPPASK